MRRTTLSHATTFALALILATTTVAQVTATATALQQLRSSAGSTSNSIPAGSNVIHGAFVGADNGTGAGASTSFAFDLTADRSAANLVANATGLATNVPRNAFGSVEIVYSSPVPILAEITMTVPSGPLTFGCFRRTGTVEVVGNSRLTVPSCAYAPGVLFCQQTITAPIDSNGLRIRMTTSVHSPPTCGGLHWVGLQVDVSPVSVGTPFGASCGVALSSTADLLNPGIETIHVDGVDPMGVLLIGGQQLSTTLGGFLPCPLLTNSLVGVPLVMDQNGDASLSFPVSRGPFFVQAATSDGATIRLSDGLRYP